MGTVGWTELLALLTSVGMGILAAILPVINAEAYVVVSQVSSMAGPVPIAISVGIGQMIGKVLLFLGVRRGKDFPFVRHRRERLRPAPPGSARAKLRVVMSQLLNLVGQERWGLPIVFVAALFGLPPLFAVALLAGATTMKVGWFALVVLVGRVGRFVLIALGSGFLPPMFG